MTSKFEVVTDSECDLLELFDVSLNIDAHVHSMSRNRESAVRGRITGQISLGETVTWRARHFGIWWTMTTQITEYDRPKRFVDRQIAGPFKLFRHEHEFRNIGGATRMIDFVTVSVPFFGRAAEQVVFVPYLRRLIRIRNRHLLATIRKKNHR